MEFAGKVLLNLKFCHFTSLRKTNVKRIEQKSWETIKKEMKSQQELNMKLSRRHLADYVKKIAPKSVPHVHHDYFSSFNQSDHWFFGVVVAFVVVIS